MTVLVDQAVAAVDPKAAHILAGPTQTEQIQEKIGETKEADELKGTVVSRMVSAFTALAKAEDSVSKGLLADAVLSIVPVLSLPAKMRPKYAKIAELILGAMGREVHDRTQVRLPDDSLQDRMSKPNGYKQYATPFVTMARWEAGMWNKAEARHAERNPGLVRQITYHGEKFTSPVSALRAGVPYMTTFREFRNAVVPRFLDLNKVPATKAEGLGKAHAKRITVPIRATNDDGVIVKTKADVAGHQALTTGVILGLIEAAPNLSQSNFDKINAALLTKAPKPVSK